MRMYSPQRRRGRRAYAEKIIPPRRVCCLCVSAVKIRSRFTLLFFAFFFCLLPFIPLSHAQNLSPRFASSRDNSPLLASDAARRGEELRRKWNLDGAEAAFREALALDPANITAALGLSRIARAKFDYVAAIRVLDKANKAHPRSAD